MKGRCGEAALTCRIGCVQARPIVQAIAVLPGIGRFLHQKNERTHRIGKGLLIAIADAVGFRYLAARDQAPASVA